MYILHVIYDFGVLVKEYTHGSHCLVALFLHALCLGSKNFDYGIYRTDILFNVRGVVGCDFNAFRLVYCAL